MGFYGNITNTSRTTFQFDKIYSSRQSMDDNCGSDGIYAGRYVLVEYDTSLSNADYNRNWYLITDVDGRHVPYGSVSFCATENSELYFNGPNTSTIQPSQSLQEFDVNIIFFDKNKHFTILNDNTMFIKVKRNGTYTVITQQQFENYYTNFHSINTELTPEMLEENNIIHAHIANGVAHIENTDLFEDENTEIYAIVLPGARYEYNVDSEFWVIEDTTFTLQGQTFSRLTQLTRSNTNNYTINYNIDRVRYNTSRGYDSTVWQKVYTNGTEKYVMIAELNTVVPTFGVSSDPPSLLPISPHFGEDSTNVYYELHWQPAWGFRVKAADSEIMLPKVKPNGELDLTDQMNIQSQYASVFARDKNLDEVYYPSDQYVQWKQTFENNTLNNDEKRKTLYFNPVTQKWETDTGNLLSSAIYFNKKGFDSNKIAYSEDLISDESKNSFPAWNRYNKTIAESGWVNEDSITITPTGLSGNSYHAHDGSIDLKPQPDTQELSIMLPSIGDTMARIWDLVYGGRSTTQGIATTGFRNKDIAWEDAKGELSRRGLRLTGIDGDEYNKAQVDTLAGAINTAHDLIGMIISSNTSAELEDIDNLDPNRIYYDSDRHQYFRKHKTYEYTEVTSDIFEFNSQTTSNLNQEKIDTGLYYVYDDELNEYVVATVYDPSETYYLKEAKPQFNEVVLNGKILANFPYENYKWYQDYLGENSNIINGEPDSIIQLLKSDYILDPTYQKGRTYYQVTEIPVTLSQNYLPETYWYLASNNDRQQILLDMNETRTKDRTYYIFNTSRLLSLKEDRHYNGIYIPGKYYFKKTDGTFEIDLSDYQDCNGYLAQGQVEMNEGNGFLYYELSVVKTYDPTTGVEVLYRRSYEYVPVQNLTEDTYIKNTYYVFDDTLNDYTLTEDFIPNETYYLKQTRYQEITDTAQVEIDILETYPNSTLCIYKEGTYFLRNTNASGETLGFTEIGKSDFLNDPDINNKEVWVFGDKVGAKPPFVTLNEAILANDIIQQQDNFYQENTYHFKKNGSYILDTSLTLTPNRDYYNLQIEQQPDNIVYYEPGVYYVESPTEYGYELAIEPIIDTEETTLYIKDDYYVINDERNILPYGTKWNPNALAVPDEITLATREDKWELVALQGFSKNMATLNGMIIKMYQALEPYDTLTRDNNVSGVINQLKDLIARFETMQSQEIMIVDNYGRAHSAPIATSQRDSYNQVKVTSGDMIDSITKDKFPQASTIGTMQKRWITVNVDGDPNQPIITIHHNFQPVDDTTSFLNKNGDTITQASLSNIATDNIQLYTPIVDGMGHVVGKDIKTITLPYGFKTFTIANENVDDSSAYTTPGSGGSIIADNTQDTFTFKTVNKWLRFVTNASTDTLTIAHKEHTMTANQSEARTTNLNADNVASNSNNDKIVLHDIVWDAAAHMLEDHPHTYTLPYGFKFIQTDVTSDSVADLTNAAIRIDAESTQDTATFKTGNIWMKMSANANDDSITFGHLVRAITVSDIANTNLNIDNSTVNNVQTAEEDLTDKHHINIQDITHDEAGHIRSRQTHTYTLPFGYKFITTNGSVGDTATNIISNTNTAKAINTQDTFSIDVGNTWIKAAIDVENRKITLYHYIKNDIDFVDSTATDFNNISNGVFTLKDISHDDAGHIIAYKTHQYTLPYSFKTFTHSNNTGTNDLDFTDYIATSHNIVATNVIDSFEFASQNKWIRLQANNKSLQIAHLVNNFTPTEDTATLNSETTGTTTFKVVESINKDEAGHLSAINSRTFTMPNSFGKINLTNSNTNNSIIASNTTGIEADCTHDTFTISAGDRWILLNGNANDDIITIGHNSADSVKVIEKGQTSIASLNYGETFKTVYTSIDYFGHVNGLEEYVITLPSISLTNVTNTSTANVITGISLNSATGAFSYTQKNVSELELTNFNYNSSTQSNADLDTGDTINNALAKLQKKIYDETTATTGARDVAIKAAVESLDSSLTNDQMGKTLTGITITDGKIIASTFGDISILASQVTVNNSINFDARYYTETEINTIIQGLVHTATGTLGTSKTITVLTEVDGKISYTVSDISITSSQVSDLSATISDVINALDVNNSITSGEVHLMKSLSETDGKISYISEALAWSHISPLLPVGDDAFLTVGTASSTYQPKEDSEDPYVVTSDIENVVTSETEFEYEYETQELVSEDPEQYVTVPILNGDPETIAELFAKVAELEARLATLENNNS